LRTLLDKLASLRLTIATLILISAASGLGTLIVQRMPAESYIELYGSVGSRALHAAGLTDVYRSRWFIALLALFGVNLAACTVRRCFIGKPGGWFLLTHFSILLTLAGVVMDLKFRREGAMAVGPDAPQNHMIVDFYRKGPDGVFAWDRRVEELPFQIALRDFRIDPSPPVLSVRTAAGAREITVPLGGTVAIPEAGCEIRLLDYMPDAEYRMAPAEPGDPGAIDYGPAVGLTLEVAERAANTEPARVRSTRPTDWYLIPRNSRAGRFFWQEGEIALFSREVPGVPPETLEKECLEERYLVALGGKGYEFDAKPGETVPLEGTPFSLRVIASRPDFRDPSNAEFANPAAQVELIGPGGADSPRWVFAFYPDFDSGHGMGRGEQGLYPDARISYFAPARNALWFYLGGEKPVIFIRRDGGAVKKIEPNEKDSIQFPGRSASILYRSYIPTLLMKNMLVRRAGLPSLRSPALLVEAEIGSRKESAWVDSWTPEGSRIAGVDVAFRGGMKPVQFYSDITIREPGKPPREETVSVNNPVSAGGFKILQSGYDQEAGQYAVLQIVSEPGVPLVYAGMILLSVGVTGWMMRKALKPL